MDASLISHWFLAVARHLSIIESLLCSIIPDDHGQCHAILREVEGLKGCLGEDGGLGGTRVLLKGLDGRGGIRIDMLLGWHACLGT